MGDVENFIPADSLKTPEHIQPEWYFLFAYAILRSIPNKLGGVVAMFSALLILLVIPLIHTSRQKGLTFRPIGKILYWLIITNFFLLTWIGAKPVEDPYILVGQVATFLYFLYPLILMPTIGLLENKLLTDK